MSGTHSTMSYLTLAFFQVNFHLLARVPFPSTLPFFRLFFYIFIHFVSFCFYPRYFIGFSFSPKAKDYSPNNKVRLTLNFSNDMSCTCRSCSWLLMPPEKNFPGGIVHLPLPTLSYSFSFLIFRTFLRIYRYALSGFFFSSFIYSVVLLKY